MDADFDPADATLGGDPSAPTHRSRPPLEHQRSKRKDRLFDITFGYGTDFLYNTRLLSEYLYTRYKLQVAKLLSRASQSTAMDTDDTHVRSRPSGRVVDLHQTEEFLLFVCTTNRSLSLADSQLVLLKSWKTFIQVRFDRHLAAVRSPIRLLAFRLLSCGALLYRQVLLSKYPIALGTDPTAKLTQSKINADKVTQELTFR
jgi:hypothetical protein